MALVIPNIVLLFTLIELMVVIAIIAIVTAIAIPNLVSAKKTAACLVLWKEVEKKAEHCQNIVSDTSKTFDDLKGWAG